MKGYVSSIGKRLMADLRMIWDHRFEERCGAILQTVFPDLRQVPARSTLDRAGVDHCLLALDTDELLATFQCKGFEVEEFSSSQLRQCLHSINAFAQSSLKTKKHFIIVNRIVKGELRERIEAALNELVIAGKAEDSRLLDLEAFLDMVFREGQKQLLQALGNSVAEFQKLHRVRMAENIYLENAPYHFGDTKKTNPSQFAAQRALELIAEASNRRSWLFLSGEFGFGKTSLALHLAGLLEEEGLTCLYLPVAQFQRTGLEIEKEFIWEALQIILPEEIDRQSDRHQILNAALKEIFKREKRIVLIFDGIDEHPTCWRENGLQNIFGIFKTFNATCIFTVREEFLAERAGHFEVAIKKSPGILLLRLLEWPDDLILLYTALYGAGLQAPSRDHVKHFAEALESGKYVEYYGDIPKRPLFLKMLLDDIAKDDLRNRNLSELYATYIAKKFEIDREGSTTNRVVSRPLTLDEDYTVVCARLFEVMTLAAGKMYTVEDGEVRLEPRLPEISFRDCLTRVAGGALDVKSILLNSVMVPIGRRDKQRDGYLEVAFAHTSFQEYFLAHYILKAALGTHDDPWILSSMFPKPVERFLKGLLLGLPSDQQARVRANIGCFLI